LAEIAAKAASDAVAVERAKMVGITDFLLMKR
jgi:hypothetical protein